MRYSVTALICICEEKYETLPHPLHTLVHTGLSNKDAVFGWMLPYCVLLGGAIHEIDGCAF